MEFVEKDSHEVYLAFGANLPSSAGSARETLVAALIALAAEGVVLTAISRFFKTPAYPAGSGPDYVNACAKVKCGDVAEDILALLHRVEAQFGRTRGARWAARGCDIDLLAIGTQILPDAATQAHWRNLPLAAQLQETPDQLILPHPRLTERAFVLIPLFDIAPHFVDPVSGIGIAALIDALPEAEKAAILPI
jgi:2-amino-4-hydroxy-6-hydroxymethyldihydropteridine diphosphokinase